MKNTSIRRAVRRAFTAAGEVAKTARLIRKTSDPYSPGSGNSDSTSDYAVRFLATEKPLSARQNAADPLLEANIHYGLLECELLVPRVDDDLHIGSEVYTLLQVVAADLGAGILYDVTYQ